MTRLLLVLIGAALVVGQSFILVPESEIERSDIAASLTDRAKAQEAPKGDLNLKDMEITSTIPWLTQDRLQKLMDMPIEEAIQIVESNNPNAFRVPTDLGSTAIFNNSIAAQAGNEALREYASVGDSDSLDTEYPLQARKESLPMWNGETWTGPDNEKELLPRNPKEWDSVPFPSDEEVQKVIGENIEWMLKKQDEAGKFETQMMGILRETADDAIDAVIATSMSCLALRKFENYAPQRINEACRKGADFIMSKIIRGKLPIKVFYACWRYELALRYLLGEYQNLGRDQEERADRIKGVCRRCIQMLLNMQLTNGDKFRLDRAAKVRVKGDPMPGSTGVICEVPTDEDFDGGALVAGVKPGSWAEEVGIQAGDRITSLARVKIFNGFDFYSLEDGFVETQKVEVTYFREEEGGKKERYSKSDKLPQVWPGTLGVSVTESGKGVEVTGHLPGSEARKSLKVGDVITRVGRKRIESMADFEEVTNELEVGDKLTIKKISVGEEKEKKAPGKVEVVPLPKGNVFFQANDEFEGEGHGIEVAGLYAQAQEQGINIQQGDIITEMNGVPILGYDHFDMMTQRLYANQEVTFKVLRGYEDPFPVKYKLGEVWERGSVGFVFSQKRKDMPNVVVASLEEGGPAEEAGIRVGDHIIAVDGDERLAVITFFYYLFFIQQRAGQEYTLRVAPQGDHSRAKDFKVVAEVPNLEVMAGGWNYYPMDIATSFTSSAILLTFDRCKDVLGIRVPRGAMKLAENAIKNMRRKDKVNDEWMFVYSEDGSRPGDAISEEGLKRWQDTRGGMGRLMACNYALHTQNPRLVSLPELKRSLARFEEFRWTIDRLRRYPHTHHPVEWSNAAYYWFYGHYFTMLACKYMGKKEPMDMIVKATMLKNKDVEGPQWLGHEGFGKLVGTCQAMFILGEYRKKGFDEGNDWFEKGYEVTHEGRKKAEDDSEKPSEDSKEGSGDAEK